MLTLEEGLTLPRQIPGATRRFSPQAGIEEGDMANHTAPLAKACSGRLLNLWGGLLKTSPAIQALGIDSLRESIPTIPLSQPETDPHLSAEKLPLLWAGSLTSVPSFPPPNPIPPCASAPSLHCSVVPSDKPQHLPKGTVGSSERSGQCQAFAGRPEGSCLAAEGEGSEARSRQPAGKHAYERQTCKQAEKAPLPASAPLPSACTPVRRGSSPRRLRAPLSASQPLLSGSPPPAKPAPGAHGFKKAGSWHRHC